MTDAEWQAIELVMPWPAWLHGNGGRPEKYCRRLIVDAIRYVVDNGCKWRNLPAPARRSIRRRYADGEVSLADLATEYSAGRSTIHRIIHGQETPG
jgi:hypothetical protein